MNFSLLDELTMAANLGCEVVFTKENAFTMRISLKKCNAIVCSDTSIPLDSDAVRVVRSLRQKIVEVLEVTGIAP